MNVKGYEIMKRLAILVSTSLVIGIPLLHGCEKLNRIKTEQVSTTTEGQPQSNWVEEVNTTESESNQSSYWDETIYESKEGLEQAMLEGDIKLSVLQICVEMKDEVSKGMIVDCLVDVHGYDRKLVNEIIDEMCVDWKYYCKVTFKSLLNEGHEPDRIPLMLEALQFTEEEIQYAIDNQ